MTAGSSNDKPHAADLPQAELEETGGLFTLDASFLEDVGLARLSPPEANVVLAHVYEIMALRVGMQLAEAMTDAQFDEFEALIDANDEDGALRWLESNFPDYRDVVKEEYEAVTGELRQSAPLMLTLLGIAP